MWWRLRTGDGRVSAGFGSAGGDPMGNESDRRHYPWWVRVSLFGTRGRRDALANFWLFLALVPLGLGIGVWLWSQHPTFRVPALIFIIGSVSCAPLFVIYWLAIRWVDRHGQW